MESDKTYILILRDSINNKIHILENLIELTESQAVLVKKSNPGVEEFEAILDDKDRQIEMLNMLDDGFANVYDKIRSDITDNPAAYRDEIEQIQALITKAVELGSRLEAMEHSNRELIEDFISRKKSEVKQFRANKNMVGSYNRNMPNQHMSSDSYFMNQKK